MTQRIASTTSTENDTVAFVDEVVDVVVAMDNGDDGDGVLTKVGVDVRVRHVGAQAGEHAPRAEDRRAEGLDG